MENKNLPEDLIPEILLRLPVKSLIRFKCVSKSWHALICEPHFAKSHFERSAEPTRRLICQEASMILSIDPDSLFHDHPDTVRLVLPFPMSSGTEIVDSCRGFIMLHNHPAFILWNPSTGDHKQISYSHIVSSSGDCNLFAGILFYGFWYDASKDDYLVVLAWFDKNEENHFQLFSLRNNSWENIYFKDTLFVSYMNPESRCWLFLNGAIYLFEFDGILTFDLIEKKLSRIPLPEPEGNFMPSSFMLMGGCISQSFRNRDNTKVRMWVIKEQEGQSSWMMYEIFDSSFFPICLAKDGAIIGYDGKGGLKKYNDKGELLEHCAYCPCWTRWTIYTESILSLPRDFGEAGESEQQ